MTYEPQPLPRPREYESQDDYAIDRGIALAEQAGEQISNLTARLIASQLHDGQASSLYSLASSGAVDQEALDVEIRRGSQEETSDECMQRMYRHLGNYSIMNAGRPQVDGWSRLSTDYAPDTADAEYAGKATIPRVWLGCLAAHNAGVEHGEWTDARDPDGLEALAVRMLYTSPSPDAVDFLLGEYQGFKGARLSDYDTIPDVATLAQLVHKYGESFGRWLTHSGHVTLEDAEEHFQRVFIGEFATRDAYVEHVLQERDAYAFTEYMPIDLRDYVYFNLQDLGDRWEIESTDVLESEDGTRVYIYNRTA